MAIVIFQHSEENRSGRLGATLRDYAHRLRFRALHKGEGVPPDFDNVTGVVSLGGPQNVGDDEPWMDDELAFLREAHDRKLPVIGVCLGAQMIAAALGGEVAPMDRPEIGMRPMTLTSSGHTDTAMAGVSWTHPVFCHHTREITKAPEGATVLASSEACNVQAFRAGLRTYAFQYHLEADTGIALEIHRASQEAGGGGGVTEDELRGELDAHYQTFARLADRVCVNLAAHVTPAGKLVGSVGGR